MTDASRATWARHTRRGSAHSFALRSAISPNGEVIAARVVGPQAALDRSPCATNASLADVNVNDPGRSRQRSSAISYVAPLLTSSVLRYEGLLAARTRRTRRVVSHGGLHVAADTCLEDLNGRSGLRRAHPGASLAPCSTSPGRRHFEVLPRVALGANSLRRPLNGRAFPAFISAMGSGARRNPALFR